MSTPMPESTEELEQLIAGTSERILSDLQRHTTITGLLEKHPNSEEISKLKLQRMDLSAEILVNINRVIMFSEVLLKKECAQIEPLCANALHMCMTEWRSLCNSVREKGTKLWYSYNINIEMLSRFGADPTFKYHGWVATNYESKYLDNPFEKLRNLKYVP